MIGLKFKSLRKETTQVLRNFRFFTVNFFKDCQVKEKNNQIREKTLRENFKETSVYG